MIHPSVRAASEAWGAPAYDIYAFHEVQTISAECPARGGLHVWDDAFIVEVVDTETGRWIAGARAVGKETPADTEELFRGGYRREPFSVENTTLAVIATADLLTRDELRGVARMGHSALCRAIRPVHTPMDGDIVVAVATGVSGRKGNALQAAALGTRALEKAIADAVCSAKGNGSVPSMSELQGKREK